MKTAQQFFSAFKTAGFLKACSWTPSQGGATIVTSVRFKNPDRLLADAFVQAADRSIEYPATALPGLVEGELVTLSDVMVDGVAVPAINFRVRTVPMQMLDGSLMRAELKRVA